MRHDARKTTFGTDNPWFLLCLFVYLILFRLSPNARPSKEITAHISDRTVVSDGEGAEVEEGEDTSPGLSLPPFNAGGCLISTTSDCTLLFL